MMADFDILDATKKGYKEYWDNKDLYLRRSILVLFVHWACFYIGSFAIKLKDMSTLQENEIPYEIIAGPHLYVALILFIVGLLLFSKLYIFQARHILTGEVDPIFVFSKKDPEQKGEKDKDDKGTFLSDPVKRAYVIGIVLIVGLYMLRQLLGEVSGFISLSLKGFGQGVMLAFALIYGALMIWMLRLGVAHIPAAINYPLKEFMLNVKGFRFSVFLLGLIITTLLPLCFALLISVSILAQIAFLFGDAVATIVLTGFLSFSYVVAFSILNGASVFAVDEVMREAGENGDS